jgi:hypothetical protein
VGLVWSCGVDKFRRLSPLAAAAVGPERPNGNLSIGASRLYRCNIDLATVFVTIPLQVSLFGRTMAFDRGACLSLYAKILRFIMKLPTPCWPAAIAAQTWFSQPMMV